MAYQAYPSVAQTTLGGGSSIAEEYVPLVIYSSSLFGSSVATVAGNAFIQKGNGAMSSFATNSQCKLHTLNSNWSPNQKFAFEASLYIFTGGFFAYAALWDVTAGAIVGTSQISTTSTTFTVVRSGSFTLIPGHVYAISLWESAAGGNGAQLTKAQLVALTQ